MGRLHSRACGLWLAIVAIGGLAGCGSTKAGPPLFAGKVTLTPAANTSLVLGATVNFSASVQTATGINLGVPVTYASTDTSVLNISSNGVACAGHWDAAFTSCTPGSMGVVQVTASALGSSSVPTYVFVHPPIDNITVNGVLPSGAPLPGPCLSQSQSMTVEAHAFSQGLDITSSVGPFTFTATNPAVVTLTGLPNSTYNFATNQATARANAPGIARIVASANGVSSSTYQQPQYQNSQNQVSPPLDFFATCPIQNISLEVGTAGSGRTMFSVAKTTSQTAIATVTDVWGNSSLPNTNGGIVLTKTPLTWASSHPSVIAVGTGCTESCSLSVPSVGAAAITASCSPPTCNIGFPQVPQSLSTDAQINACTQFYQAVAPAGFSCRQLIPLPVYASPVFVSKNGNVPLTPATGDISGVVTGTAGAASVLAASTDCSSQPPAACFTGAYFLSTAKATTGSLALLPTAPNSFGFDFSGSRIYMGSDFGAVLVNPSNFGTANSPFTSLGTITGKLLAISNNGGFAVFSDTKHTPNQAYVINASGTTSIGANALNIANASAAAFSPDGLKTFIVGGAASTSLYIYSGLQALQGPIPLSGAGTAVAFSPNGAFGFVAEAGGTGANVSAYSVCNNQLAQTVALPADPILMRVLPNSHLDGKDSYGNSIPDGIHILVMDATGFDLLTATISAPAAGTLCPQSLSFISGDPLRAAQRIELGQGTLQPGTYANFFTSGDGTQIYVANGSTSTILIYDFVVGSVTGGIQLQNAATPLSAEMAADGGTIVVSGSDGMLHEVSTTLGGADLVQLSFPNLPDSLNPFCSITSCALNVAITKP